MTYANRISTPVNGGQRNGLPGEAHAMRTYGAAHAPLPATGVTVDESYKDLDTFITAEDHAYWCFMRPSERPSFTRQLLIDLEAMQANIGRMFAAAPADQRPFDYFVLGSRTPGVFNLGGDLVLFRQKIEQRDADTLRRYAYSCVESGYANYTGYGHRVITIALIQGDALGGGLESALSCDMLVAERQAKFGLPEILFNLFPGMGAYSFLARKIGAAKAEEMIMSGRIYTAEEMHALGVVDILVDEGEGERAVKHYIAGNRTRHSAHSAIYQVRRRVNPVTLEELRDVTDTWVEAAMRLSEQDLRKMARIAAAQDRSRQRRMASMAVAAA
ncbi:crotonase/enoyl-CoA hydratase family protein [Gluconacetobacter sacchari]|uniref:crotonase/enoyl-CoA hydratase family protein n=1 Tax=Gluconacetobacter sacchari TaxID=92759 RepID=UPI0039B65883